MSSVTPEQSSEVVPQPQLVILGHKRYISDLVYLPDDELSQAPMMDQ